MTPTLSGRLQTRVFLAATVGLAWTAVIAAVLPRPAGLSAGSAYRIALEALGLMTAVGLGWELLYHAFQQARWDKDWPSLFALVTVLNEATLLWFVLHTVRVIHGTTGWSSPALPFYASYVATTWLAVWLFAQGPIRVLHIRWRFEGGQVITLHGQAGVADTRPAPAPAVIPAGLPQAAQPDGELVEGVRCHHGHFCHPSLRYCAICGDQLRALETDRVLGVRPPVGILILDDGTTRILDQDLLLTRPTTSSPLRFKPVGKRSRARGIAVIRISGWTPVACSEGETTVVRYPGGCEVPAGPGVPIPLIPGSQLWVAGQWLRYESPYPPDRPRSAALALSRFAPR